MPRPSKGTRDMLVSRPARAIGDEVRSRADQAGVTISDYISILLAEHCGMPHLAPARKPKRPDEELHLTG